MADTKTVTPKTTVPAEPVSSTELAKVTGGQLVQDTTDESLDLTSAPDFAEKSTDGMEHLTKDDILMPRIGLAQQMSPELVEGDAKYIDGLKIGNLFNTVTKQIYGNTLLFTVIRMDPPRYVEFIPREAGGGIKDPNVPANDPRTQWGANGEKPLATKFYDFLVMLQPSREIVALSFKSTGIKAARQLNGLVAARNRVMFAGVFKIVTKMTQNTKGRFAIYEMGNAGWIIDKRIYEYAKQLHEGLANKDIKIDREGLDDPNLDPDTFDVENLEKQNAAAGQDTSRM